MHMIFTWKHSPASKLHSADGHIRHHWHLPVNPRLRRSSWTHLLLLTLSLAPLLAILLLTIHMTQQASAMTIQYCATTTYTDKRKLNRHACNLQFTDTCLTINILFGAPREVREEPKLIPLMHRAMLLFTNCTPHPAMSYVQLYALHYNKFSTVSQQWLWRFCTRPIRSTP